MIFTTMLSLNAPHNWAYRKPYPDSDTSVYKQFAILQLQSIAHYHPYAPVHMLGINLSAADVTDLENANSNIKIHCAQVLQLPDNTQAYYKGMLIKSKIRFMIDNLDYTDLMVYLDTDTMLRASLDPIVSKILRGSDDFAALYRAKRDMYHSINAGVMLIPNTPDTSGAAFLEEWLRRLPAGYADVLPVGPNGRTLAVEQKCLFEAWHTDYSMRHLAPKYNDRNLMPRGVIWHGCVGNKLHRLNEFILDAKERLPL